MEAHEYAIFAALLFFLIVLFFVIIFLFFQATKKITDITHQFILQKNSLILATEVEHMGIWSWHTQTDSLRWNNLMYEMYKIPHHTPLTFSGWKELFHPDDRERIEQFFQEVTQSSLALSIEFRIILNNGETRLIQTRAIFDHSSNIITGTHLDSTKKKQALDLLEFEKEKLKSIIAGANIGTWEWHVQKNEQEINERWADILGYTVAELSPVSIHTWKKFCHPDDLSKATELLEQHFSKKVDSYACDIRMKHKNGNWIWVHTRGKVAKWSSDNKPLHMFGTHQDITLRKQHEEKNYQQANYDPLTGLATRQLADARISLTMELAERSKKHVGFLFIDLNKFKAVNDQYGHDVGDSLLKEVARRIRSCIRKNDTASRIGGDEFIVVLAELHNKSNAQRVAKAIIHEMSKPTLINNIVINIGVSIGISAYPDDGMEKHELIKLADTAMYKIKKTGKSDYGLA